MIAISSALKHLRIVLGAIFLLTILSACSSSEPESGVAGDLKPEKVFKLHSGETHTLDGIADNFVLMNYWASWCKPCVKEIPELNALDVHDSVAVYAYNFDRLEGEALQAEADKFKLALPMMMNEPAPMFLEETPAALPATLVVNKSTGEQQWLMGAQTKSKILTKLGLTQTE